MHDLMNLPATGARAMQAASLPAFAAPIVRDVLAWVSARDARGVLPPPDREGVHLGARPHPPIPNDAEQRAAIAALERLAPALAPATLADWDAFLRPVAAGCRNPPTGEDFEVRKRGIATCADLPRGALTPAARRRLKPGFFPGAEDVTAACEAEVRFLHIAKEVLTETAHGPTTSHPLYGAVAGRVTPAEFRRWFGPLRILRREEERRPVSGGKEMTSLTFTLAAPSRFHADRVRQEYGHLLSQGLGGRVDFEAAAAGAGR